MDSPGSCHSTVEKQVLRDKMSQKNSMISTPSTFSQAVCEASVNIAFLEYQIIHSMTFSERTRIQNRQTSECFLLIASLTGSELKRISML